MKKGIHPKNYTYVVFQDVNNDFKVLTRSTIDVGSSPQMVKWEDGSTYPLVKMQISSASHSFYTGKKTTVDELGNIAKFEAKYGKKT